MRIVLTVAMVFASSTAFASSITVMSGAPSKGVSFVTKICTDCRDAAPRAQKSTYNVPELEPGTQKTQIVDINGEKKLVRTEAWFGGSPVIYVSKFPKWMADEKAIADLHPRDSNSTERDIEAVVASGDGVDIDATTSAVRTIAAADAGMTQASAGPAPLALETFELRTN